MINENGLLNIFPTAEASGSIVSFENGADGIPMESLSVTVEPTQDLHGYDHPWPAGGGKNLADVRADNATSFQRILVSGDEGYLTFETTGSYGRVGYTVPVVTGQTYTISFKASKTVSSNTYSTVYVNDIAGNWNYSYGTFPISKDVSDEREYTKTITATSDTLFLGFYISAGDSYPDTVIVKDLQVELGSSKTSYSPYSNICPISGRTGLSVYVGPTTAQADATTYAVDWTSEAGTVYGGTLDVVTGVLTVDRATYTLDGDETITTGGYGMPFKAFLPADIKLSTAISVLTGMLCNQLTEVTQSSTWGTNGTFSRIRSGRDVYFKLDDTITTVEALRTYLASNPLQFVYELATPLTYQLSAQEVATLLGANRVWSDAGDISLVYHTQVDATPSSIDGLFINGEGLQADGWFLKWRKLAAPKPKTDYVSVWGRDGDIDLTESETDGQVFYENRELTMDMVYMGEDWTDAYSELLDMLHGKECAVQFSNDPYWYWAGRIIASLYEHKPHSLAMSGIMFPYKLSVAKVTKSATVSGAIESNGVEVVLPSSRMRVSPKVTVVAGTGESVTLKWGTKTQTLSAGTYYVRGLKVGSDDVTIKVLGTGTVTFEYRKGML